VLLALISAFAITTGIGADSIPKDGSTILRTLLLLPQNKEVVGGTGAPIIIVAWSLQYELIFYAAMGLFIIDWRLGWAGIAALAACWILLWNNGRNDLFPAFMHAKYFLFFPMGVAASMVSGYEIDLKLCVFFRRVALVSLIALWVLSVIVMIATKGEVGISDQAPVQAVLGILAAFMIVGATKVERNGGPPAGKIAVQLGGLSYAIYLLHFPMISAASKVVSAGEFDDIFGVPLVIIITLSMTLGGSLIFHKFIEKPAMRLARGPTTR
jgi:peptidoglycan/LPS O-acetylase OafA/YrhL